MKQIYTLALSLLALLMISTQASANKVIVKGTVTFTGGGVAANWPVVVTTDSNATAASCRQSHTVYTNANGYYLDTLSCSGADITKVRVYTHDCNNAYVSHDLQVVNNTVESNFTICAPVTTGCEAGFTFTRDANSLVVHYNSSNAHGVNSTDKIIKRRWKFADGDTLGGNVVDPAHTYAKQGSYSTCLTIWTAAGCENTICKTITIADSTPHPTPPVVHCSAKFVYEIVPASTAAGVYVKFNSSASSTSAGDSIRERIWKFGDGTTASTVDPAHYYAKGGVYNVCLIIRSVKGCSDSICTTVQLPIVTPPTCHADFSYSVDGANIKFNSSNSSGDSIISRQWIYGDSSAIGTTVDPSHKYAKSGVYTVCLYIKTARGCESKECKQVNVTVPTTTPPVVKCAAVFTTARVAPKKFTFNSSASAAAANDSIIERSWSFGDGSATLGGNIVSPSKEYARPGIYTVCVKIRTAKGCDNSYCTTVKFEDTTSTPVNTTEAIKIVSLHPNPVVTPLTTEVWSKFNNITAELSIYDIYGTKKWSTSKVLLQGTNVTSIPTASLLPGPYFFRVTTMYGVKSASFYKL